MCLILIVDDDIQGIEAVKANLCSEKLNISEIFTAHNMHQAQKILTSHQIDILLCDIEMPNGTGLDLLTWMQERNSSTVAILLTCHADFKYARQALKLGCLDYLLKPVNPTELEQVLIKALHVINENTTQRKASSYQSLWHKNYALVIESFWLSLINNPNLSTPASVQGLIENMNLPITLDMNFLPIMITIRRYRKELSARQKIIAENVIKRLIHEIISDKRSGQIIKLNSNSYLVILLCDCLENALLHELKSSCEALINSCSDLRCDLSCSIGKSVRILELSDTVGTLSLLTNKDVILNRVVMLTERDENEKPVIIPDMALWATMIKRGNIEEAISETSGFLERTAVSGKMNATFLNQFYHEFFQMIYLILSQKNIDPQAFFKSSSFGELERNATSSITDMKAWVKYVIKEFNKKSDLDKGTDNIVEKIQHYIAIHLDEDDMSRESIAGYAFISPDHLTRIFKKKMNISISDYIMQERMKKARDLLLSTKLSISAVASAVGYSNFSHFAKMFKKNTGYSPKEFRVKMNGL